MSTYSAGPPSGYPPQFGQGRLAVTMSKPFGAFGISPKIRIDGFPAPAQWERNTFPVAPGRHQVQASVGYLWEYGAATQLVDIAPGESVELFYSSPMITLVAGRIGFEPQPRPGRVGFWLIVAVPLLIVLAIVVGFIGTALSG